MSLTLKSVPFRTQLGTQQVSRDQILAAMNKFDQKFRTREDDSGTLYAIKKQKTGRRYPPKRILELATGTPRTQFSGGRPSNDVFSKLGFLVVDAGSGPTTNGNTQEQRRLKKSVPSVKRLIKNLFAKIWVRLDDDSGRLRDSQYPGVYVLAYPHDGAWGRRKRELAGQPVREEDIFYVGVSHAGVRKRLRQFIDGLENGGYHSGAKRFFHQVANGTPYSKFESQKPFFVAFVSVPCTAVKPVRSPLDLRKMGVVAELEWYVLARVKEKTKAEPWLNKK